MEATKRDPLQELRNARTYTTGDRIAATKATRSRIKVALEAEGISYADVAALCGVSVTTVGNWINKGNWPPEAMAKVYFKWFRAWEAYDVFDLDADWYADTMKQYQAWQAVGDIIRDRGTIEHIFPGVAWKDVLEVVVNG